MEKSKKQRLSNLLNKTKALKRDHFSIKGMLQKFTFSCLLPKKMSIQRKMSKEKKVSKTIERDKENISHHRNVEKRQVQEFKTLQIDPLGVLKKKQNILKQAILCQLNQIKSLQKREESIRKTSQRLKIYSSQRKREYESCSKQKKHANTSIKQITICESRGQSSVCNSQIQISIPLTKQKTHQIYKCPNFHQYFDGQVNHKGKPHGNGRYEVCCAECPRLFELKNFNDIEFYQGQFKQGKFDGFGTLSYRGSVKYVGQFHKGNRQGKGSLYYKGKVETAKWSMDNFVSVL